jgi:hypothetical protein
VGKVTLPDIARESSTGRLSDDSTIEATVIDSHAAPLDPLDETVIETPAGQE